jgi:aminoglycoside phosphotransferase family enzyme
LVIVDRPRRRTRDAAAVSAPVAVRETHIGVVFLVGDRAYK